METVVDNGAVGANTRTVAKARPSAVKPFAYPWAIATFIVEVKRYVLQAYAQLSLGSSKPFLLSSPNGPESGAHLSSTTVTPLIETAPGFVTVYKYVTLPPPDGSGLRMLGNLTILIRGACTAEPTTTVAIADAAAD